MYQALKSKYIKKSMFLVIFLIAAGIAAIASQAKDLKVMMAPAAQPEDTEIVQLEDLEMEDLKEGLRVEAEIPYVMDYYAYRVEAGKIVEKQYLIIVNQEWYMGMILDGREMRDADELVEIFYEYLEGNPYAYDDVEPLKVQGTIVEITGEYEEYYRSYIAQAGFSQKESEESFLSYAIKVGEEQDTGGVESQDTNKGTVILVLVVGVFLILLAIITLVRALTGANFKKVKKYVAAAPNEEMVMQSLDRFYESTQEVSGIRVSPEYFLGTTGLTAEFCPSKDIVWVYQHVVKHSVNLIPTGKTYSIMVMTTGGERIEVLMKNKKKTEQAMEHIARTLPYIFMGYGDDIQAYYTKNRQGMIDAVAQKRAEVMGAQTQFDQNVF